MEELELNSFSQPASHDLDLATAIWPHNTSAYPRPFIWIYGLGVVSSRFGHIFAQPAAS